MDVLNKLFPKVENPVDFAPPLLRLQAQSPNPMGRKVLWAMLILLGCLILWMLIGRLDIVSVAEGKLVPQTYVKIVQPSEAGIVKEILVKEGQTVTAGQVLMRMDTLITDADAKSLEAEHARKQLGLRRIDAELSGTPFRSVAGDPPDLARETESQYRANRAALEAALAEERSRLIKARQDLSAAEQIRTKLAEVLPHYREQEKAYDKLAKEGFAGPLMLSDKRRERIEKEQELRTQEHVIESARAGIMQSEKKLTQINSDYRRQLYAERTEVANALDKLTQEVAKQTHRQALMELKAPQAAVVKDLATHTSGTVVQPGTVLLTLVPKDETLRAEVWVSNEDIGFVRPGQKVRLKFAAFPFQKYGMIDGTVEHVSADAADNTASNGPVDPNGRPRQYVYKALVTLKAMNLELEGEKLPLSAGMQTYAEILLGTRTVAEYLLSPVQKAWHESGRER
ncbi:HlyD family secretion protein [Sulfuritortus calidifontis]|uniref:Membrane fusion protein (MFP) family protein n=1 Tax=Sulfuritortus calidifontis TaxID=1914471 RepID=A0A4R3JWJ5_9PROT|nr:HlyD family type I secretion periplasmic adaptor subunit [Sulfuritortus calidifontis]TCS72645.1 HlyD family secretion protein [Sulfuritortus calidifontis]